MNERKRKSRKPYKNPKLRHFGELRDITQAGFSSSDEQKTQDCNENANSRCINPG